MQTDFSLMAEPPSNSHNDTPNNPNPNTTNSLNVTANNATTTVNASDGGNAHLGQPTDVANGENGVDSGNGQRLSGNDLVAVKDGSPARVPPSSPETPTSPLALNFKAIANASPSEGPKGDEPSLPERILTKTFKKAAKSARTGPKRSNTEKVEQNRAKKASSRLYSTSVKVYAWGDGMHGKLGLGNIDTIKFPTEVLLPLEQEDNIQSVIAGSHNTTIVTSKGLVFSSGHGKSNHNSTLFGDMSVQWCSQPKLTPFKFKFSIVQVELGNYHCVVLTRDGSAYTWGWGGLGQLGHGDNLNLELPKRVHIKCAKQVAAGTTYTMILTEFGELYSFGDNAHGQLGVGSTDNQHTPNKVRRLNNVRTVSCGIAHSIAVTGSSLDTRTWMWGQTKSGAIETVPTEVTILRGKPISQLATGEWHSMALSREGSVYVWEIGSEPTQRLDLKGKLVKQMSAGNYHSAFVTDSGQLYTYGRNALKQLGREGEDAKVAHQVTVNIGEQYVHYVSCGDHHTTALVDGNPRHLLLWKFLKMERRYLTRLLMIMEYYNNVITKDYKDDEKIEGEDEFDTELFAIAKDLLSLQWDIMEELDSSLQEPSREDRKLLGTILKGRTQDFHVYLKYADAYSSAATALHKYQKKKSFSNALVEQKKKLIEQFNDGTGTTSTARFNLSSLIFEPLRHIAKYVKLLKKIIRATPRQHMDKEMLSYVFDRFEGLLERVCKNFTLVNPLEILRCTLNEIGQPEIGTANLSQLVERLTHHQLNDIEFTTYFLLTYRFFTTPKNFLDALIKRYHAQPSRKKNDTLSTEEEEKIRHLVQDRVIYVITLWIKSRVSSYDFEDPTAAINKEVLAFVEELKKSPNSPDLSLEEKILKNKPRDSLLTPLSLPECVPLEDPFRNVTHWDAELVASCITSQDFEYYKKIQPREFLRQAWCSSNSAQIAPNILSMTSRFNDIGSWVVYEIVTKATPKERAQTINHFLMIVKCLRKKNNLNGLCAIMSGLNNAAITRLKRTLAKVNKEKNTGLEESTKLVEGADNYKALREIWKNVEPPAIPFLAITLRDLTFLEDGNPDRLEGGGINFYKWRRIAEVIQAVLDYQHVPYDKVAPQEEEKVLRNYIQVKIEAAKQEGVQGLFSKSKKCE